MARETYVLRDGRLVEKRTGIAFVTDPDAPLSLPTIIRDIPDYRSPIDGRVISSRSERREDLKRNNCVEWDPAMSPTRGKAEFKNARFAKKHRLPIGERTA